MEMKLSVDRNMKSVFCCAAVLFSQAGLAQMPDLSQVPTSIPQVSAPGTNVGTPDAKSLLKQAGEKVVVHLNSASPKELQKVPGLSADNVSAIVAARPFKSVTDLAKVKGISQALYAKIKPYVRL